MPPAPLSRRVVKYKCITRREEVQSVPSNLTDACTVHLCRRPYVTTPVFTSNTHYMVVSVVL